MNSRYIINYKNRRTDVNDPYRSDIISWKQKVVFAYLCSNHFKKDNVRRCPICEAHMDVNEKGFIRPSKICYEKLKRY